MKILIDLQSVVSCGVSFVLLNPDIFSDPLAFKPERWIGEDARGLDKYLVVFSKGPRSCVAIKSVQLSGGWHSVIDFSAVSHGRNCTSCLDMYSAKSTWNSTRHRKRISRSDIILCLSGGDGP